MLINVLNRYFIFLHNQTIHFVVIVNKYGDERNCKFFAIKK